MDIKGIERVFNEYSKSFYLNNKSYYYKFYHSHRVKAINKYLAMQLNLDEENINISTIIGLLHDIGRYRQLELFNSYSDLNIDHADLGVKILFEDNLISSFPIEKKYYDILYFTIKNHNKYEIEPINDENILYHARLIRDSDKLDILDSYVKGRLSILSKDDSEISLDARKNFYEEKSINIKNRHNISDSEILRMALIFDINFDESILLLQDKKIMENYYKLLKGKEKFIPYLDYLSKYVEKRSKSYVRKKV